MAVRDVRALFEAYHGGLFRFLLRMTGERETAQDLLQETFLRAARRGPSAADSARAWLYAVARNLLADRIRRRRVRGEPVSLETAHPIAAGDDPERSAGIQVALRRLPPAEREALLLRELGGLSYREIAGVQGGREDAVRNRIYRARKALRCMLCGGQQGRATFARGKGE